MKLQDKRLELRVGLFIFIGLLLLFVLIFVFQGFTVRRSVYIVNATLPFGGGIQKGTPVMVAGYDVGRVQNVEWDSKEQLIRAILHIDTSCRIKEDAALLVDSKGMLGETYLEFTPGSPDRPDLKPGATVRGTVPPTVTEIKVQSMTMIKKITQAVSEIGDLAAHLNEVAGQESFQENIRSTVANTAKIAGSAARSAESVQVISKDVAKVVKGVDTLVGKLKQATDDLTRQINERGKQAGAVMAEAEGLLKELRESNEKLNEGLKNISEISLKIREGDGTVHKLIYERELYDRANELMRNAGDAARKTAQLAEYLREHPSELVWGKEPIWYKRWWRWMMGWRLEEDEEGEKRPSRPGRRRKDRKRINLMPSATPQEEGETGPEDLDTRDTQD